MAKTAVKVHEKKIVGGVLVYDDGVKQKSGRELDVGDEIVTRHRVIGKKLMKQQGGVLVEAVEGDNPADCFAVIDQVEVF